MEKKKKTHLGLVFVVLPSPVSLSIDHVPILLPPMLVCWNWLLPAVVEEDEQGGRLWNHQLEHGSCVQVLLLPKNYVSFFLDA